MTAVRLGSDGANSPRYAVVGQCAEQDAVSHVGILESERFVVNGENVPVFHMANPIALLELPGRMSAHVVGWVLDMPSDEHEQISLWLEEQRTSSIRIEYVAFPSTDLVVDKVNGRQIGRKFSCAGFVQSCFEEALHVRLVVPTEDLPEANRNVLIRVWGERFVSLGRRYGLHGSGPWKILLPSYLLCPPA